MMSNIGRVGYYTVELSLKRMGEKVGDDHARQVIVVQPTRTGVGKDGRVDLRSRKSDADPSLGCYLLCGEEKSPRPHAGSNSRTSSLPARTYSTIASATQPGVQN